MLQELLQKLEQELERAGGGDGTSLYDDLDLEQVRIVDIQRGSKRNSDNETA